MSEKVKNTVKKFDIVQFLVNNALIILIIASAVFVGLQNPRFFSMANIKNLLANTSVRMVIALGISGVLIMRNNDLSAGRQVGLAGCICATLLQRMDYAGKVYPNMQPMNMWLVCILVMIGFAITIGLINGLVVSKLHVPAFIGSYGMQTIVYGIALIYTGAQPIGGLIPEYTDWAASSFLNIQLIPNLAVVTAIVMLVMWFLYNHTPYGKKMYAIGGNPDAAEVSGINTTRMTIASYMIAASLFALAGFMLGAKAGGTSSNLANGYELFAIAGCTIGGVSVNGGTGKVSGILMGVLVFEILKIEMTFLGIDTAWTYIVQGIVIVVAIALDIRKYIAKR
ncbi:MAG: beta-methylgalactoside transporter [Erysipelotrichaceae bacterium]|nr:beta-methylgalactoside transporter [Erysipelotrichaceae bacterium]